MLTLIAKWFLQLLMMIPMNFRLWLLQILPFQKVVVLLSLSLITILHSTSSSLGLIVMLPPSTPVISQSLRTSQFYPQSQLSNLQMVPTWLVTILATRFWMRIRKKSPILKGMKMDIGLTINQVTSSAITPIRQNHTSGSLIEQNQRLQSINLSINGALPAPKDPKS